MGMGKRKEQRQEPLFVSTDGLSKGAGHPFYVKLNELLAQAGFDRWVEERCRGFYEQEEKRGRPSLAPGVYFRMLFVGYFEQIGSQRGIAWRCADSLGLRRFLGIPLDEPTPDHSTLTYTRRRLDAAVYRDVFRFVLQMPAAKEMVQGRLGGVDSTTLEANAAMKSIVRRDTNEDWNEYITRLMREEGLIEKDAKPSHEEIRRYDRERSRKRGNSGKNAGKRSKKKASNKDWQSRSDPDSRITRMKNGRTRMGYKAEHVVDLESDLLLGVGVCHSTDPDTQTLVDSIKNAQENMNAAEIEQQIEEVAADKGYHATPQLVDAAACGLRTYIPEIRRDQPMRWTDKPEGYKAAFHGNRSRVRRTKSKRIQKLRSERCERSFAHICDTGGMRRQWVRGLTNITKHYQIAGAAYNLSRIMRRLFGVGKPRTLQGRQKSGLFELITVIWSRLGARLSVILELRTLRLSLGANVHASG